MSREEARRTEASEATAVAVVMRTAARAEVAAPRLQWLSPAAGGAGVIAKLRPARGRGMGTAERSAAPEAVASVVAEKAE